MRTVAADRVCVSVRRVDPSRTPLREEVIARVREAMEAAGWIRAIPSDAHVAVKPNFCIDFVFPGAHTSPWVMEGVLATLTTRVRRITMVEADTYTTSADRAFRALGMEAMCRRYGVDWVNLTKAKTVAVERPAHQALPRYIEIPEILARTLLVTVPVLKTHGNSIISGAIKNQWGCLPKTRLHYHEVITQALAELNRLFHPAFAVMDGTIASEGKGPKQGKPKVCNLVLAAADNVALDAVAAALMGIPEGRVAHLTRCAGNGSGVADLGAIDVDGPSLDELRMSFRYGEQTLLTRMDLACRRPVLKTLLYRTPLLHVLVGIARCNYPLWMALRGERLRSSIINGTPYGAQWRNGHG